MVSLTIDNKEITVPEGSTILDAARSAGIYIPVLCSHPDLPPFQSITLSDSVFQGGEKIVHTVDKSIDSVEGCGICLVHQVGIEQPIASCKTKVAEGMTIQTNTVDIRMKRQENLMGILAHHPHACLTCSQREGCIPLTDVCPGNVPVEERCCALLGLCELQKIVDYVGMAPQTPRYRFENLPKVASDPLFNRDYNLCIHCGRCVRICQSVKGVYALGAVIKNGELTVGTVDGPKLNEAECKFCGACVEVCLTGALQDEVKPRLQGESELVPCKAGCPAEVDIPLYIKLIEEGQYQAAGEVIASKLPLPSVLGKVCFHPCEHECRHGQLSESLLEKSQPLSIRRLKDFAMDKYSSSSSMRTASSTGKNVAVIGSGPTGLTAAYFLARKGHDVTIYESKKHPGGMLRYGIPRYRLPQQILEKDLRNIFTTGIKLITNTTLGKDFSLNALLRNGTDAVFLAMGLSNAKLLPVPGAELDGILNGLDFLRQISENHLKPDHFRGKNVVVLGGGNVAVDAARSAVRLQAESVTVVCLESRKDMPAYAAEISEAEEENILFKNEWGIEKIVSFEKDTHSFEIGLKKCTRVFNEQGEFAPSYDESIKDVVPADSVLICIGQETDTSFVDSDLDLILTQTNMLQVDENTLAASVSGVFAGGDIVTGPSSVIEAVAAGRKAANSIDRFLGGDGQIDQELPQDLTFKKEQLFIDREAGFAKLLRVPALLIEPDKRKLNFAPVELTFSEEAAVTEAHRCLKCDHRLHLRSNPAPPENVFKFTPEAISKAPESEGVIQLLDNNKDVTTIKGCENIKSTLLDFMNENNQAAYFTIELDPMFTKRESELIQQFIQKHGKLPTGGDELDDLF